MSSCNTTRISCPKCQHSQDFTIWNSVNVDLDSSLKDRLLSGVLTRFTCDQCQSSSEVVYPLLYHDMTRQLMVNLTTGKDVPDFSSLPFGKIMKGYQLRVVASRNQLVEKIRIAESNLDDRVMELFKLSLMGQMGGGANDELLYAGEDRKPDGSIFAKFAWINQGGIESITTHMEAYTDFAEGIAELLDMEFANPGEWLRINPDYAAGLLAKYTSGSPD